MKAICTESKNFELFENTKKLGRLTYKNWFSTSAEIEVDKVSSYEIKPKDMLGVAFSLHKDNIEVATLKMNLNGQMVFAFKDEQGYVFKRKSMLNSKYIIENNNGQELIRFMPSFDWRNLKYSYDIAYEDKPDILLVLTGMYCANYFIALSGGAVTATV
jgi:hypothetical protein